MTAAAPGRSEPSRARVVVLVGALQILSWGSTYYLPAVLAGPISRDTGWPLSALVGGLSWSLLVSAACAPRVGGAIDRLGGRPVLATGSALLAAGLATLGLAPNLAVYYLAWTILGVGMAAGLYEAAFSTIGRLYGGTARPSITGVTLLGGLASTFAWPIVAALEAEFGWRATCFAMAGAHLLLGLPGYRLLLPRPPAEVPAGPPAPAGGGPLVDPAKRRRALVLLAAALTLYAGVASGLAVHVLEALRQLGLAPAAAIAIGMAIGPAQVGGRIVEFAFGRRLHPVWTGRIGIALVLAGVLLLAGAPAWLAVFAAAIYGAGNGIMTIARGTLPLALFGPKGYGATMGLTARFALIAQAAAPILLAVVLERGGPLALFAVAAGLAALAALAFALLRSR